MKVHVASDTVALAADAASYVATVAASAIARRGRCVVAFSGGRTPTRMLQTLSGIRLDWSRVHVGQVDERLAPEGHPDRNLHTLRSALLDQVTIPPSNVHPMPVEEPHPEVGARRYACTLQELAGDPIVLDLVHLGLGRDGHTASLVPGDPVLRVLDRDVAVTDHYQGWQRMTLTYPALARARNVLWLVSGADKRQAVRRLLAGDRTIPAAGIPDARAHLAVDTSAYPMQDTERGDDQRS